MSELACERLVCVADAVGGPPICPGTPASFAGGLSLAWACAGQARSAKELSLLEAALNQ